MPDGAQNTKQGLLLVESGLGGAPDGHQIYIVVASLVARYAEAGTNIGIQHELLAERQVQRAVALSNWRCHWTLEPNPVFLQVAMMKAA